MGTYEDKFKPAQANWQPNGVDGITIVFVNMPNSSNYLHWRRDGNMLQIIGGLVASGAFSFYPNLLLPVGITIDESLIVADQNALGTAFAIITGNRKAGVVHLANSNTNAVRFTGDSIPTAINPINNGIWAPSKPAVWASGDQLGFSFSVPIVEWA